MARELYIARLARKDCISEVAQCYHFEFVIDSLEGFPYAPGQFISAVAEDENGKNANPRLLHRLGCPRQYL